MAATAMPSGVRLRRAADFACRVLGHAEVSGVGYGRMLETVEGATIEGAA
jgi:hypothetical protein